MRQLVINEIKQHLDANCEIGIKLINWLRAKNNQPQVTEADLDQFTDQELLQALDMAHCDKYR